MLDFVFVARIELDRIEPFTLYAYVVRVCSRQACSCGRHGSRNVWRWRGGGGDARMMLVARVKDAAASALRPNDPLYTTTSAVMEEDEAELRNPFPAPPSHYNNYTSHNLALLSLFKERAEEKRLSTSSTLIDNTRGD